MTAADPAHRDSNKCPQPGQHRAHAWTREDSQDAARELFGRALEVDPDRRRDFVRAACNGDTELRRDVESLLQHDDEAAELGRSLRIDAVTSVRADRSDSCGDSRGNAAPGWEVPGFAILKRIGEGGMGVVYEAQQHMPRRRVAIKVLRDDVRCDRALRRFEFEGHVLAHLTHPGIARVYETGTIEVDGRRRPYLAMERVDGVPITAFVTRERLDIDERVRLMTRVCDAVQHAHQKGIFHRDLKPGNILVDGTGQPRIVDFGTAGIDDELTELRSWQTATAELIGTIRYMSPEQLEGESGDVDARSDIYALGVVLYEILTGRMPHASSGPAFHQLARAICEEDPIPVGSIDRVLRGDLEAIVQMALEKRPEQRYPSAAALADDMTRMLDNEIVQARPRTATYRLRKYIRRHRPLVAAIVTIFLALAGAAGVSFDQWRRAAAARDDAVMALDFFDSIFEALGNSPGGRDSLVLDYLAIASERVDDHFDGKPEMRVRLHESFGKAYEHLGAYESAALRLGESLRLRNELFGERDARTIEVQTMLGGVLHFCGDNQRAEELIVGAVRLAERYLSRLDPVSSLVDANWAWFLARMGRHEEAEAPALRAIAKRRDVYGTRHRKTLFSMANLGALRLREKRLEEAAEICEETLPMQDELLGATHRDTLMTRANLAVIQLHLGNVERAAKLQQEIVAHFGTVFGNEHPKTLYMRENLGVMLARAGRTEDSIRVLSSVVDTYAAQSPPNLRLAKVLPPLAEQLDGMNRFDEARDARGWLGRISGASPVEEQ